MKDAIENLNEWILLYRYYGLEVRFDIHYKIKRLANFYTIALSNKLRDGSYLSTHQLFNNQEEIDEYLDEIKEKLVNLAKADTELDMVI